MRLLFFLSHNQFTYKLNYTPNQNHYFSKLKKNTMLSSLFTHSTLFHLILLIFSPFSISQKTKELRIHNYGTAGVLNVRCMSNGYDLGQQQVPFYSSYAFNPNLNKDLLRNKSTTWCSLQLASFWGIFLMYNDNRTEYSCRGKSCTWYVNADRLCLWDDLSDCSVVYNCSSCARAKHWPLLA